MTISSTVRCLPWSLIVMFTSAAQSSFQIGGVPVIAMNDASIMFVMWNRQNAIGTTPSRSKWFTWSIVIVSTAS